MGMKVLTIVVPCYNSQDYMRRCIDSLLPGGETVEIVIVDDGSTDSTANIADEYASRFSSIVRVIHQKNGGHGGAIMTGLHYASGIFFKVVDSDDWLDETAYRKVLDTLSCLLKERSQIDLMVCDYVYDKDGARHKHNVSYSNALPVGKTFSWQEVRHFRIGQYILMHAAIYRTDLLRQCELDLPQHTFYVDNLFVYVPLKDVQRMIYLDISLYHYYIGRDDQSVNETVMISRIDQQLKVNRLMLETVDPLTLKIPQQRSYMRNYLEIITTVSSILLVKAGGIDDLEKKKHLWRYMKSSNRKLYRNLRLRPLGILLHLPGRVGRKVMVFGYNVSKKVVGFN